MFEMTVKHIIFPGFYRLLEGEYANRVVIYSGFSRVDDRAILIFANGFTWTWKDELHDIRCERTRPTFPSAIHTVDKSEASWYADSGEGPLSCDW